MAYARAEFPRLEPRRRPGRRGADDGRAARGHAALLRRRARVTATAVVVTVFVNPLQFGPGEDLDRYPRTLDADLALCARRGRRLVFAPAVDEVYPGGAPQVTVDPGAARRRCWRARARPGHFAGVLTVVAKLLRTRPARRRGASARRTTSSSC